MGALRPKDRVKMAVSHVQPDRPPIQTYLEPEVRQTIESYFGGQLAEDVFEVDLRYVGPGRWAKAKAPAPGSRIEHYDEWGTGFGWVENNAGGKYLEALEAPIAQIETMDEVANYPWPDPAHFDYDSIPGQIEKVKDYAVCIGGAFMPDIINGTSFARGMERVLVEIASGDEVGTAIVDKRVDYYYEFAKRCFEAGNGQIDILCLGDDLGTQGGPTVSPALFDSFFRPRLKRFIDLAHSYGAYCMMHSCGCTRPLQPRLIEMGLDILDAVQSEPVGMDPEGLKRDFGERLTYCGMISTQYTLPHGSVEECRAEARHRIDVIGKGGGYIFSPGHNIQPDTPLENILAIYEEATGKRLIQ